MRLKELLSLSNNMVNILKDAIEDELKHDEEVTSVDVIYREGSFEFYIDYANEDGRFSEGFEYSEEIMYFYKKQGKQILDLRGDLIITHNDAIVKGRIKSAAPASIRNIKYVLLNTKGFIYRIKVTIKVINFIWGPSQALTKSSIEDESI